MRRTTLLAVSVVAVLAVGSAVAIAAAAKFHRTSSSVTSGGALVVSFDQRGLGNEDIDYVLSATGTATYACINRGGKNPSASNKRTVSTELTEFATFEPKNGRVVASISTGPPGPGDFACPPGQRLVLAGVS